MASDDVPGAASTFELLADETRVRIVRELALRRTERPSQPALTFSELRARVGIRDTGRFNYHLKRLRGRFVEKVDGGYVLTPAGATVSAMVLDERVAGLP